VVNPARELGFIEIPHAAVLAYRGRPAEAHVDGNPWRPYQIRQVRKNEQEKPGKRHGR